MTDAPVALITGAARRIGRQLCIRLHQQGFQVLIHCNRSIEDAEHLAAELNQQRADSVRVLQADLCDPEAVTLLAARVIEQWQRLDVLINNASSFYPTPIEETAQQDWDNLIGSNLRAPFFLSQSLAPLLSVQRGCIINLVDIHALRPLKGHCLYSVAKAGNAMLTQSLAKELAPDIRVNGIAPGAILWPESSQEEEHEALLEKIPLGHFGDPDDIADTALFLMQQSYITGQIIAVDGGKSLYS